MPVNTTHPDYDAALPDWLRARDVLAGEDAVKSAGEKYLPRLDSQRAESVGPLLKKGFEFEQREFEGLEAPRIKLQGLRRFGERDEAVAAKPRVLGRGFFGSSEHGGEPDDHCPDKLFVGGCVNAYLRQLVPEVGEYDRPFSIQPGDVFAVTEPGVGRGAKIGKFLW
jgi:hypothetical protein